MRRPLALLIALSIGLLLAQTAGAAATEFGGTTTVAPSGAGQFTAVIQNTDTDAVLNSFTFVPGPKLKVTAVLRSDVGNCVMSGATFTCNSLGLAAAECFCLPGGIVNVTFTGTGDASFSSIAQVGSPGAVAAAAAPVATPAATAASGTASSAASGATKATTTAMTVLAPKTLKIAATGSTLTLTAKVGQAATLSVSMYDATGHLLAHWSKRVTAGTSKLALPLPVKARHAGRDTIRVVTTGADAKTLGIVLLA